MVSTLVEVFYSLISPKLIELALKYTLKRLAVPLRLRGSWLPLLQTRVKLLMVLQSTKEGA